MAAAKQLHMKTGKKLKGKKSIAEIVFIVTMLSIPVAHFIVFWLYINADTIALSLQRFDMNAGTYVFAGFAKYSELLGEFSRTGSVLPSALLNSFSIFLWNDFILVPISLLCAYVLKNKVPLGKTFRVLFFLPSIISVVVMIFVFRMMLDNDLGIVNDILRKLKLDKLIPFNGWLGDKDTAFKMVLLYGLWTGIGNNIVLMSGAITRIPDEIYEAGKLEGITLFRELFSIVIPLIGTTLATLMLLGTTVIFTYFLPPMLLVGDNAAATGSFTIAMYIVRNIKDAGQAQINLGAAVGVLCAVIGTPIVIVARKILDKAFPGYEY